MRLITRRGVESAVASFAAPTGMPRWPPRASDRVRARARRDRSGLV